MKGNHHCRKSGISGPRHVFGEALKVPGVARDQFVGLCLLGHQKVFMLGSRVPRPPPWRLPLDRAGNPWALGKAALHLV